MNRYICSVIFFLIFFIYSLSLTLTKVRHSEDHKKSIYQSINEGYYYIGCVPVVL